MEHPDRVTTGMIKGERRKRKQREMMLDGLTKWLVAGRVRWAELMESRARAIGRS